MFQYEIIENEQTVEDLLKNQWRLGKKIVHELRMNKAITIDGTPVNWKERLEKGTILQFSFDVPTSNYKPTKQCIVPIRYEDEHCLVVSKPKGMATHPNEKTDTDTCINHVMSYVESNSGHYAEHVHRLDRGTDGLLLIAKHPLAKSIFDRMLEEKSIVRTYEAEVQGIVRDNSGTIRASIGKDRHHATRRVISKSGQHAVTHFNVIKRLKNTTIVQLQLETGRTHQIRVHLAHLGHPIVGDAMYGARQTKTNDYALHAIALQFHHPFLNKEIVVKDQ